MRVRVCPSLAYGLLLACGVAALAGYGISYNYGGADFPLNVRLIFTLGRFHDKTEVLMASILKFSLL